MFYLERCASQRKGNSCAQAMLSSDIFLPDSQLQRDALKETFRRQRPFSIFQVHHFGQSLQMGRVQHVFASRLDQRKLTFGLQLGANGGILIGMTTHQNRGCGLNIPLIV
jgi:hypothetical protein